MNRPDFQGLIERFSTSNSGVPDVIRDKYSIHIAARNLVFFDAISNLNFGLYSRLRKNGVETRLYRVDTTPGLENVLPRYEDLSLSPSKKNVIIYNYSIHDPKLGFILQQNCYKIFYYHNITPPEPLERHAPEFTIHLKKGIEELKLCTKFDKYIAHSLFTKRQLLRYIQPKEVDVIYPIFDMSYFNIDGNTRPEPSTKAHTAKQFLYTGQIAPHKKIDELLLLFSRYDRLDPNFRLYIVGACSMKTYEHYLINLLETTCKQIAQKVIFLGNVSQQELYHLFKTSDCFITLSEYEGFCVPIVEALYCGTPAFCFDGGGSRESLGNDAYVFKVQDPVKNARILNDKLKSYDRDWITRRFDELAACFLANNIQKLFEGLG